MAAVMGLTLASPALAVARPPDSSPVDVTMTATGRRLATQVAARHSAHGVATQRSDLRVWRVAPGDYVAGRSLPDNVRTGTTVLADGRTELWMTYDTDVPTPPTARQELATAAGPAAIAWSWVAQGCFSRIQNTFGWLDSCYAIHRLTGEGDPREFFKLEQYGTVAAKIPGKIYDGWLAAVRRTGSAAQAWIDWSPRGSLSGSCVSVPLEVSALGVGFRASGIMCERWNIFKGAAAGHFKEQWSCGCIVPFGQPYPNTREIDYLQAVSVGSGKVAQWTLSAGFTAIVAA
jgi:hypothetical protein